MMVNRIYLFRVIIAGGRYFNNPDYLYASVSRILINIDPDVTQIVSGGQRTWDKDRRVYYGADYFGELYAKDHNLALRKFEADWDQYGRAAGPIRNKEMADYATHLIAFWDGTSKGTKNMIEEMQALQKPVRIVKY